MPYRYAHWWVLACMGVILWGFWPSYWSEVTTSRWEFHLHGIVSTIWVLLVAAQSWTIHHKKRKLHRLSGQSSLYLFPFLIMGLIGIGMVNAQRFAAGPSPFSNLYADTFFFALWPAVAGYLVLFYNAMKYRRKVWAHSAFLLGTPMILFESPASRILLDHLDMFAIDDISEAHLILDSILVTDGMMVALALILWWRARARSNAFAIVAGFIALQMVAMSLAYYVIDAREMVLAFASIPVPVALACGFIAGAAASWLGWQAGKTPQRAAPAGAVPAE